MSGSIAKTPFASGRALNHVLVTTAAVAGLATAARAVPTYTLDTLGLPSVAGATGDGSTAYGINNRGQVCGYYSGPTGGYNAPFVYSDGTFTPLATLGGRGGNATSINDSGVVAGFSKIGGGATPTSDTPSHLTVWDSKGVPTDLGRPLDADQYTAVSINAHGVVVGSGVNNDGTYKGYRVDGTTVTALNGPSTSDSSIAVGINAASTVVGAVNTAIGSGNYVSVYWDKDTTVHTIPRTPGVTDGYAEALVINDNGLIAGIDTPADDATTADLTFYDLKTGTFSDAGHLDSAYQFAIPQGINIDGVVVGQAYNADFSDSHGFIYEEGKMYDLNDLVGLPAGWELQSAQGINDAGQIVGYALDDNSNYRAFLLTTVPEPSTLALLAGTAVLGLRRRQCPTRR